MRHFCSIAISIIFVFIFGTCAPTGAPVYTLGTPHFVPRSLPDVVQETGIGQNASSTLEAIFLQWNSSAGAAGYYVYRSDSTTVDSIPSGFEPVDLTMESDTSGIDGSSIQTGIKYFYFVKGLAPDKKTLSNPSDTARIQLLDRPTLNSPGYTAHVDRAGLTFMWHDNTGGGYTVIRVEDQSSHLVWVKGFQMEGAEGQKQFNYDGSATDTLKSGNQYQWRVDRFNPGTDQQAKSIWQTFFFN